MTPQEFAAVAELALKRAGLVFTPDKTYLVESRLGTLLRRRALGSPTELIAAIRRDRDLAGEVVDALVNSETSFFRDKAPFEMLRDKVVPELLAPGARGPIRVWSAACATGQEPYSIAMTLDGGLARRDPGFDILGTDISEGCIRAAREGRYTEFEMRRGLGPPDKARYFELVDGGWRARQPLRDMLRWRTFNLLDDAAGLGVFEIVFCRNVLIYFDTATRRRVLENICKVLAPAGFLFVGASETMFAFSDLFAPMPGAPGVYRPTARRAAA